MQLMMILMRMSLSRRTINKMRKLGLAILTELGLLMSAFQ